MRSATLVVFCVTASCRPAGEASSANLAAVARELDALGGEVTRDHHETFDAILADTLAKDAYACAPSPHALFAGQGVPDGARDIVGEMPHYGLFFGPMSYRVEHAHERFVVSLVIAVEPPAEDATLDLPDCALAKSLDGASACVEDASFTSTSLEPCAKHPAMRAPASKANVDRLLARWSRDVAPYFERDAHAYGLPIDYRFSFVREGGADRADLSVPLATTCGRTPYFSAIRSGWAMPVLAHEMGHVLGLLDEYETFSGMVSFYPKTPFPGAERSRMGLSMREASKVLPLHHYLIVRRYACEEPRHQTPYPG